MIRPAMIPPTDMTPEEIVRRMFRQPKKNEQVEEKECHERAELEEQDNVDE